MSGRTKDGKSLRFQSLDPERFPHGTVARYVAAKCRCRACRDAIAAKARERSHKVRAAAPGVEPNGPPGIKLAWKTNHGVVREFRFKTCPGTGGAPCVRGGAWLREAETLGARVCMACVDRALFWNGLVSTARVRRHLAALRKKGIGRRSIASACDVGHSLLQEITSGKATHIRAQTERRILAVDEGCRTDGCRIPAERTRKLVERILARGFTQTWLSRQLGCSVYVFSRDAWKRKRSVSAATAMRVDRVWRRVQAGELVPRPRWIPAAPAWRLVRELLDDGLSMTELGERLSYPLQAKTLQRDRIRPETAEKIEKFHQEYFAGAREAAYDLPSIDELATARPA